MREGFLHRMLGMVRLNVLSLLGRMLPNGLHLRRLRLFEQLLHPSLHRELSRAGYLASRCRRDAGVQPCVLGVDVLEDQGQGVLLVLEEDLEARHVQPINRLIVSA